MHAHVIQIVNAVNLVSLSIQIIFYFFFFNALDKGCGNEGCKCENCKCPSGSCKCGK